MIPGMNPRQMKQAMRKMGMEQVDIEATSVVIKTAESEIVFTNPQVAKVKAMGSETWQISGEFEEHALDTTPEISEEDVKTVMEQANVSEEEATAAIEKAQGDLAAAIMSFSSE